MGAKRAGGKPFRKRSQKTELAISSRHRLVLELKTKGLSDEEIADECGYASPSAVWKVVNAHIKKLPAPNAELLRRTSMARIELLVKAHLPVAQGFRRVPKKDAQGNPFPNGAVRLVEGAPCPKSAQVVLRCIERTNELYGLTVKKVELTGKDGAPLLPRDLANLTDEELDELANTAAKDSD